MDEMSSEEQSPRGPLFYIGSAGLLTMMAVEAVAVIGRHTGLPVTGALEIVQFAIVPAACAAMLIATLRGAHAAVHMLTDRMSKSAQRLAHRIGAALASACFAALCAGSAWLTAEFWNSFEQSEVLDISFRPIRLVVTVTAAALSVLFLRKAMRPEKPE